MIYNALGGFGPETMAHKNRRNGSYGRFENVKLFRLLENPENGSKAIRLH